MYHPVRWIGAGIRAVEQSSGSGLRKPQVVRSIRIAGSIFSGAYKSLVSSTLHALAFGPSPIRSLPCEALMPFTLRPYRRFPVCCPVTYHAGPFQGQGTIWNLSVPAGTSLVICRMPTKGKSLAHDYTPE